MPDTKSVAMLFRRFKTNSSGGNGFTSLKDRDISISACGLASVPAGSADVSPGTTFASPSDLLPNSSAGSDTMTNLTILHFLGAELLRLAKTSWYVRLRSFLKVS